MVTPCGGLNSRVSSWPTAVFNAMEVFKNDFRCITMDQRNANSGEFRRPVPVDNPWDAMFGLLAVRITVSANYILSVVRLLVRGDQHELHGALRFYGIAS